MSVYQVMPPLSAEEYEALKADIAERGVLVPVVRDQHGNLIDGHHRARIADELGVKYRVDVVHVANEDEARSLARMYNLARRHLSREQKRQLIAAEIEANPDRSDRAIGRLLGCDHKTVGVVRRVLSGEIPHLEPESDPEFTDAERSEFERLTERIAQGLRSSDETIVDALTRGVPPALLAHGFRQVRSQFRDEFAARFGDDYQAVDEMLFAGWIDCLAALQTLADKDGLKYPGYEAERAWLESWAEVRPVQHARELQLWAEAWPPGGAR